MFFFKFINVFMYICEHTVFFLAAPAWILVHDLGLASCSLTEIFKTSQSQPDQCRR